MASRKGTKHGDHAEGSVHKGRLYNLSGLTLLSLSCQLVAVFNVVSVLLAPFSPPLSALIALKPVCNDLCYNTICATAPKQAGNLLMLMLETLPTINVLLSYQIKIASHS